VSLGTERGGSRRACVTSPVLEEKNGVSNGGAEQWREVFGEAEYRLAQRYLERVEEALQVAVPECGPLTEAAQYLLRAGGRRIRPLATLGMCDALGGRWPDAIEGAVAVELIHTASLIHDDILDHSDVRRGQPALHKRFGMNVAVLTGDMLSFAALHRVAALPPAQRLLAEACLSMCRGEVMRDHVESARLKSGVLFRTAAEMGAMAARAEGRLRALARRFGEALGTAYQLRDDELDQEGDIPPEPFARQACSALDALPDSPARRLLEGLVRFAWQRSK